MPSGDVQCWLTLQPYTGAMQVLFFATFELMGWVLGDALSVRLAWLPVWARAACVVLVMTGALISAIVVTAIAVLALGVVKAALGF